MSSSTLAPEPEWLTINQVAEITGLSTKTVRRAIADGRLQGWRHGTAIRVKRDDLTGLFRRMPNAADR